MATSPEELHERPEGADSAASIAQAIQEVTERAQLLIREEVELAKAELTDKVRSLTRGAVIGIAAGIFVVVALLFILIGFAWLIWYLAFPGETYFWGFFVMAGVLLLLAGLAGFLAARAFKKGSPPMPEMAIDEAKRIRTTVSSPNPESTI